MKTSTPKTLENTKCKSILDGAWAWGPVFIYAGFLYWLSSLSHPHVPRFPLSDKIYHTILYAGFGFLCVRALTLTPSLKNGMKNWKAVIASAMGGAWFYGLFDEIHQSFVPPRSPEFLDWLSDGVGGALGGLFFLLITYVQKKLSHTKAH